MGETDVQIDRNITVTFNEPMNAASVQLTWDPAGAAGPAVVKDWTPDNMTFYFNHSIPFSGNTIYWPNVTGQDLASNDLRRDIGVANPWWFSTETIGQWIVSTDPVNETIGVALDKDITVVFSGAMNTSTLVWSINPDPLGWTEEWAGGDTILYLNHSNPFDESQHYDVQVECNDITGMPLDPTKGAGNPWWFETAAIGPSIDSTDPYDMETGVPLTKDIVITFSEPMNTSSVTWWFSDAGISFTEAWTGGDTVLTLTPLSSYTEFTTYTVNITAGKDMSDVPLESGLAPNPWNFSTIVTPPGNLMVLREKPNIKLIWDPVPNAAEYHIYESSDRLAPWPWALLDSVSAPTTEYTHAGAHDDSSDHFYIVRAYNGFSETENSTMGVKLHLEFWPPMTPWQFSIYWLSLPYNNIYSNASDIVEDIEGGPGVPTKIRWVAKWDRDEQKTQFYYYSWGRWWGEDFAIATGDAVAIGGIQMNFAWIINGTDFDYEFSFTAGQSNWLSLPTTNSYGNASDIVIDIEGGLAGPPTKITEIGRWNSQTQTWEIYYWDGSWTGDDFEIKSGEAVYIRIIGDFTWTPKLVTPAVP